MVTGRHKNFPSPLLLSFQAKYGRISTYNIFVGCDDSLSVYWNTICKKDGIVSTINFSGDWPKISRTVFFSNFFQNRTCKISYLYLFIFISGMSICFIDNSWRLDEPCPDKKLTFICTNRIVIMFQFAT